MLLVTFLCPSGVVGHQTTTTLNAARRRLADPGHSCGYLDHDVRYRVASQSYDIAVEALHAGLRRDSGATTEERKAEFDARIELRHARAAFVADLKRFTAASKAELRLQRMQADFECKALR